MRHIYFLRFGLESSKSKEIEVPTRLVEFLSLLLKTAGFRRGNASRKSSRSRRWSRSAQTIFASWAVLGQLGGMSLLVAEVIEPQLAKANPPMAGDSSGNATSSGSGSFAIGRGATTGTAGFSQALGTFANASGGGSQASGYQSNASGENSFASGLKGFSLVTAPVLNIW